MGKETLIQHQGTVQEVLKGGKFLIKILYEGEEGVMTCYPNKKTRRHYMGIVVGDTVRIEFDRTCPDNGRIVSVKNN
jgi:translation initiation factor IF-1